MPRQFHSRSKALLGCAALLACGAALIAVDRRGFVDGWVKEAAGLVGFAFALAGLAGLVITWSGDRFRVSIGRLMLVVALVAVALRGLLIYRGWQLSK